MRSRILVGGVLLIGILTGVAFASNGATVAPDKQWSIANFNDPVRVNGYVLMGRYLIVHDNAKMARGEPCTTFYRFKPGKGPQEAEATFMCKPVQRTVCDKITFSVVPDSSWLGIKKLTEFQFAGDSEGHGIPDM